MLFIGSLFVDETSEIRMKYVQELWSRLQKLNVQMNILHFNALLTVFVDNEYPFCGDSFLKTIEENELTPNK